MRVLALLGLLAASLAVAQGAPTPTANPSCPLVPVELQLHRHHAHPGRYRLVFAAMDPHASTEYADFVDIHYRVNNEEAVNLRVLTQAALTEENLRAKSAIVENIDLQPGDALRAYATYSSRGFACDTPIHTFSAPETSTDTATETADDVNLMSTQAVDPRLYRTLAMVPTARRHIAEEPAFWTTAAEEARAVAAAQTPAACPAIDFSQDVLKVAGLQDTYVIMFENKDPRRQLHFVDLHLATAVTGAADPAAALGREWDNLRLGTDMQLHLAHKVMQPGVVIRPHEALKFFWSYRAADAATGAIADCTTPVSVITPEKVTHEISIGELEKLAQQMQMH